MTPFYGSNDPPLGDVVPDWLLGGNRKRRVLAALADPQREHAWTVRELVAQLRCGRSTVYETIRALRALDVLDLADGRLQFDPDSELANAIVALIHALAPFASQGVDRPPRARASRPAQPPPRS
jgi:hypothetical protein